MQDHWLEQVVLPFVAVGFATAAMMLARHYALFFAPETHIPGWVVWIGIPFAVISVYSASLLSLVRAPLLMQVMQAAVMTFIVYVLLRMGGASAGTSFLSNASLAAPDVFLPIGVMLTGWYLCNSAGRRFARIGSVTRSAERQVAEDRALYASALVSWSAWGLLNQRRSVVWFFNRRTLAYTLTALLFAAAAFDSGRVWEPELWSWRTTVAWATALLIFFGLLQQGFIYLYQLRSTWEESEVEVGPNLIQDWVKSTFALAVLAVGAALLFPFTFVLFDFGETVERSTRWANWFFSRGVVLLNEFGRARTDPILSSPAGTPPAGGGDWVGGVTSVLAMALAIGAILGTAFLIAWVVAWFMRGEWRKLAVLLELPSILRSWSKGAWSSFKRLIALFLALLVRILSRVPDMGRGEGGRRAARGKGREQAQQDEGTLPSAYIRRLFVRLVREARRHGFHLRRDHTPLEFAREVQSELGDVDEQVALLAEKYIEARYGRRDVQRSSLIESAWERVVARIRRYTGKSI